MNGTRIELEPGETPEEAGKRFATEKEAERTSETTELQKLLGAEHKDVKGKEAVDKLLEEKHGHVKGAFYHPDATWRSRETWQSSLLNSGAKKRPRCLRVSAQNKKKRKPCSGLVAGYKVTDWRRTSVISGVQMSQVNRSLSGESAYPISFQLCNRLYHKA